MSDYSDAADALTALLNETNTSLERKIEAASSLRGTVMLVDNDTVMVSFGGGTPIPCTTAVKCYVGDRVIVENIGNTATVTHNLSKQSATDEDVVEAADKARIAGESANAAALAAAQAIEDASAADANATRALNAASEATASATAAHEAAVRASEDAASASESATIAYQGSRTAMNSLSEIEQVIGTLNWIASNGTYVKTEDEYIVPGKVYYTLEESFFQTGDVYVDPSKTYYRYTSTYVKTSDTEIVSGKTYYEYINGSYSPVANPVAASLPDYYELDYAYVSEQLDEWTYTRSQDTTVDASKTYYEPGSGGAWIEVIPSGNENPRSYGWYERSHTSAVGYYELFQKYTAVMVPVEDDLPEYYELIMNDTVQNYLISHLVLTDEGLSLYADNSFYRLLLATDGVHIIDTAGVESARYGSVAVIGPLSDYHIMIKNDGMEFMNGDQKVSYVSQDKMTIEKIVVGMQMQAGSWAWLNRDNGNLSLVWMGEDS